MNNEKFIDKSTSKIFALSALAMGCSAPALAGIGEADLMITFEVESFNFVHQTLDGSDIGTSMTGTILIDLDVPDHIPQDDFAGYSSSILSVSVASGGVTFASSRAGNIIINSGISDPNWNSVNFDVASPYFGVTSGSVNGLNIDRFTLGINGDGSLLSGEGLVEALTNDTLSSADYITAKVLHDVSSSAAWGYVSDINITAVPAPSAAALLGLSGFVATRRRR